jgi:hypothetical protein
MSNGWLVEPRVWIPGAPVTAEVDELMAEVRQLVERRGGAVTGVGYGQAELDDPPRAANDRDSMVAALERMLGPIDTEEAAAKAVEAVCRALGWQPAATDRDAAEPSTDAEPSVELLAVTMTRDAAHKFWKALVWASGHADDEGRDEHYDWLSWGAGRVSTAQRVAEDGPGGDR